MSHRCRYCPKQISYRRDVCYYCEQEIQAESRAVELAGGQWVQDRHGIKRWVAS